MEPNEVYVYGNYWKDVYWHTKRRLQCAPPFSISTKTNVCSIIFLETTIKGLLLRNEIRQDVE